VTLAPLAWLATATLTAGFQKVFAADPRLGFLSHARSVLARGGADAARQAFNDRLDAGLALFFMTVVVAVIAASAREWWLVISKRKSPQTREAPFVRSALYSGD
jgi:carbon starvation protein